MLSCFFLHSPVDFTCTYSHTLNALVTRSPTLFIDQYRAAPFPSHQLLCNLQPLGGQRLQIKARKIIWEKSLSSCVGTQLRYQHLSTSVIPTPSFHPARRPPILSCAANTVSLFSLHTQFPARGRNTAGCRGWWHQAEARVSCDHR